MYSLGSKQKCQDANHRYSRLWRPICDRQVFAESPPPGPVTLIWGSDLAVLFAPSSPPLPLT